jgi:hypothetical protein
VADKRRPVSSNAAISNLVLISIEFRVGEKIVTLNYTVGRRFLEKIDKRRRSI